VKVYAGADPLTGREIRLRKTCKTERAAQIELGKLLEQAAARRQPEVEATAAQLMDRYDKVADWDLPSRETNEFYIRRVIKPALGHLQVRKIRGRLAVLVRPGHASQVAFMASSQVFSAASWLARA